MHSPGISSWDSGRRDGGEGRSAGQAVQAPTAGDTARVTGTAGRALPLSRRSHSERSRLGWEQGSVLALLSQGRRTSRALGQVPELCVTSPSSSARCQCSTGDRSVSCCGT